MLIFFYFISVCFAFDFDFDGRERERLRVREVQGSCLVICRFCIAFCALFLLPTSASSRCALSMTGQQKVCGENGKQMVMARERRGNYA